ncbi:M15 family metallopeptidase [Cellulomonas sp. HZM]|uniref:M15 family metallopeptidase n=1 Tax=Cellulomonas sp. HZM TaxID=1454010 RepID=UPI000492F0FB|nr:M15 family metallopeptidase [Cellulomonas sp. HZM]
MATTNNGFTTIARRASSDLVTLTVHGNATRVRAGSPAVVLGWVARQIDATVEPASTVFGWRSPAVNAAAGGIASSNHLSGTAIDFNGGRHPYEHTRPHGWSSGWSADEEADVRRILAAARVLRWGLDYPAGWRDAMHVEIKGASAADVDRAAKHLTEGWAVVTTKLLNGRAKPSTRAKIKHQRETGFRIHYVETAYREGRVWLRTRFRTWYAADLTSW